LVDRKKVIWEKIAPAPAFCLGVAYLFLFSGFFVLNGASLPADRELSFD
jgi:hypothetical protein